MSDEDVAGLHVAVHEVGLMRAVEGGGDARTDVHREVGAESLLFVEQLAQALAVDELHDNRLAGLALEFAVDRVVDGNDVGMAELGDGDGFSAEPFDHHGVGGEQRFEDLHGDLASE